MSGFKVEFSILNLRATPGIYADALASRPAAGYPGRVFIDTDNPSTGIYRDTGTVWVQIAETATSDVDTLQNVTDNGNTTTNSISVGHANTPVATIDVRQSTSGLNNASNWTITANNNPTIASGATFGTNYVNAIYGAQTQLFLQNATIGNSGLNTAGLFINTLQSNAPGSPGIITVTQASTIRAISGAQTGIFYGGTNVGVTYSHVAALKTFQPINTGSAATVTNNYGIIVADSTPSSGTVTYTNRWGIYQEGASDKNYFAANVLIKSTTDNGNALQVTGNTNITGNLGLGTSSPAYKLDVSGTIRALTNGTGIGVLLEATTGNETPNLTFLSTTNRYNLDNQSGNLRFFTENTDGTNGVVRATLDASGNLGLGVTPSAWSNFRVIQGVGTSGNSAIAFNNSGGLDLVYNTFYNGTNFIYLTTGNLANRYTVEGGTYKWYTAPSGTAGNAITFTQAMTLDASGRLGIGTATPQSILDITAATPIMTISASTNTVLHGIEWKAGTSLDAFIKQLPVIGEFRISNGRSAGWGGFITFYTDTSERMRLTSAGELLINTTTDVGDFKLQVSGNAYVSGTVGINTNSPTTYGRLGLAVSGTGSKRGIGISNGGFNGTTASPTEIALLEFFTAAGTAPAGMYSLNSYVDNSAAWLAFKTTNTTGTTSTAMTITSGGSVAINTTNPSASAILQMDSTTQGILIPRMTTTERDNIVSPAIGLLIFNTTTNRLNIYDGAWIAVH